jgi:hypothetical protein
LKKKLTNKVEAFDKSTPKEENLMTLGNVMSFETSENRLKIRNARLINPESLFYKIWSAAIITFLMYTATVMPYKVSFISDPIYSWTIFDTVVDFLFLTDLIINLNTPYFEAS